MVLTDAHLEHTNDDGELHLEGVEIVEFVAGLNPARVQTERVHTALYLIDVTVVVRFLVVAAAEEVERNREEVVVDPPGKEGEHTHHQNQVADTVHVREDALERLIVA